MRGLYVSNDRNYGYLGIRGFSRPTDYNNRILLLLNGQSIADNVFGGFGLNGDTPVPLESLDRIEIVRGPGSALYGTYAMFAVINLITKNETSKGKNMVTWSQGNFGYKSGSMTVEKALTDGANLFAVGHWGDIGGTDPYFPEFNAPETNDGRAENLDWEKYRGALITGSTLNWQLQGWYKYRGKGIPTAPWEVDFNDPKTETTDEYKEIRLAYNKSISPAVQVTWDATYNEYYSTGGYPYDGILSLEESDGKWATTNAQIRWDVRPKTRFITGIGYQKDIKVCYRYWDPTTVYTDIDQDGELISTYIQAEHQITSSLSLTTGLRYDRYGQNLNTTSPRGALIVHPGPNITFKLLYGTAFRAPNVYERFVDDPVSGYKPSPNLSVEKIRTIETVWEQRLNATLSGVASIYEYRMKDLIDQVVDPTDEFLQYQNTARVNAWGIEMELQAKREDGLMAYANYAFQRTRDRDSNQNLSNSPSHLFKAGCAFYLSEGISAAGELQYETSRKTIYETQTDGYFLSNMTFRAQENARFMQFLPGGWHLDLQVRNMFDTVYATPGGFEHLQPAIQQDGRNFLLRVGYTF